MRDLVDAQLLFAAVQSVQVVRSPQHCYALSVCVRHREFGRTLCGSWQLRKFGRGDWRTKKRANISTKYNERVHDLSAYKEGQKAREIGLCLLGRGRRRVPTEGEADK